MSGDIPNFESNEVPSQEEALRKMVKKMLESLSNENDQSEYAQNLRDQLDEMLPGTHEEKDAEIQIILSTLQELAQNPDAYLEFVQALDEQSQVEETHNFLDDLDQELHGETPDPRPDVEPVSEASVLRNLVALIYGTESEQSQNAENVSGALDTGLPDDDFDDSDLIF